MPVIFVSKIPPNAVASDVEASFSKFASKGRLKKLSLKQGQKIKFAFVEFTNEDDASECIKAHISRPLTVLGSRVVVQYSMVGMPYGSGSQPRRKGKATGDCFRCGGIGHWGRECTMSKSKEDDQVSKPKPLPVRDPYAHLLSPIPIDTTLKARKLTDDVEPIGEHNWV